MTHLPLFDAPIVKALSIRQPWAWLIIAGYKTIENRSWSTFYRGPIYIHASKNMHARPVEDIEQQFGITINRDALTLGAIIGRVDLVDVVTRSDSQWFEGPYGFVLRNPEIIKFISYRGREKFFDVPESVVL